MITKLRATLFWLVGLPMALLYESGALAVEPALNIAITPPDHVFKVGESVSVRAVVSNESLHVARFDYSWAGEGISPSFRAYVYRSDMRGVGLTELGRSLYYPNDYRAATVEGLILYLRPHETREESINLSGIYAIREPGNYYLRVVLSDGSVKSNIIQFQIVE